ncbi:hypothetical protein HYPSUDRAFT_69534 [Hypholoma sublateritium FD-334 SS-4]|uniref:Uncharacterized protein n=1 Tax=Hypholoma sublateritium (strain FD-334 SS-4) TaxID=945553 RepID=A0A0D2PFW3_HYPSF|nr:hypothetical protein HYPSUDRAFT_69534 [Hypholoma sublateritium FD-334 SS-4]
MALAPAASAAGLGCVVCGTLRRRAASRRVAIVASPSVAIAAPPRGADTSSGARPTDDTQSKQIEDARLSVGVVRVWCILPTAITATAGGGISRP